MANPKIRKLKKKVSRLKDRIRAKAAPASAPVSGPVSPLAPDAFPALPVIDGVRFAAVSAAVKSPGRTDVMLAELAEGTSIAGTFTRSATRSAAVLDCQAKIAGRGKGKAAILVNSGNANAFTGGRGIESVQAITAAVGAALDTAPGRVFTSSTGVIGQPLPHDRIIASIGEAVAGLDAGGIAAAARAIMTTDTFAKGAAAEVALDGGTARIAGIAKGSGMIAPDMATMLVYVFTDAAVARPVLQAMVSAATERTFNCITVDSDTSTSDTVLVAATGKAGCAPVTTATSKSGRAFAAALEEVMLDLAKQVVRDGEGATKLVEITVTGAADDKEARRAALAIGNSPLVKTAIAGEDPNWGRIVMAVGKSGAAADRDRLRITLGDILVAENGWVSPDYAEAQGAGYMKQPELAIGVDLGVGKGRATIWTCDLTKRYIEINADYRS